MSYDYQAITRSKNLADEIIKVCTLYKSRQIDYESLTEIILFYAEKYPDKLFDGPEYNATVKHYIGQRRLQILDRILEKHRPLLQDIS